jgi:hypothetical protein
MTRDTGQTVSIYSIISFFHEFQEQGRRQREDKRGEQGGMIGMDSDQPHFSLLLPTISHYVPFYLLMPDSAIFYPVYTMFYLFIPSSHVLPTFFSQVMTILAR